MYIQLCNNEIYLFARAVTSGTSVFYWWENVSGRCLPCSRCPADQVTIKVLMLVLIVMLSGINLIVTRSDHVWCPADQVTIKVLVLMLVLMLLLVLIVMCNVMVLIVMVP